MKNKLLTIAVASLVALTACNKAPAPAPDYLSGFDSSWQRIAIGGLLLAFIVLQRFLSRATAQTR